MQQNGVQKPLKKTGQNLKNLTSMINKKNKNFEINNYNEFVEKLNESLNEQTIIPRADSNLELETS